MLRYSMVKGIAFLLTLLAAALVYAEPGVRVVRLEVGTFLRGEFEPIGDRVIRAGSPVAVRALIEASSPPLVRAELFHPLGPLLARVEGRANASGFLTIIYYFNLSPLLPSGYYTVRVVASAGGASRSVETLLYYLSPSSLESRLKVEYSLEVKGRGEVEELRVALPSDPALSAVSEPALNPQPSATYCDDLNNCYAVYRGLRVDGSLTVSVRFTAIQRATYVNADAPLKSPLPEPVRAFLRPSPLIESDAPQIAKLAAELVREAATYRQAIARIADFVSSAIKYDKGVTALPNYEALSALWTLNSRKGICIHISRLFVALARAAGIPARVVGGLMLRPGRPLGPASAHAYAEVYVPGYGWIPVEPHNPGSLVGLVPPVIGYVKLVRGVDEGARGIFYAKYRGGLQLTYTYSGLLEPAAPLPPRLQLQLELPRKAYYGQRLRISPTAAPEDALCEVHVSSGTWESTFALSPCRGLELALNKTGRWSVKVFAWRQGFLPSYSDASFEVLPPNLTVSILNAMALRRPVVVVEVNPRVPGLKVLVTVRTCYSTESLALTTGEDGTAKAELPLLLLPCRLEAEAREERGVMRAKASAEPQLSPETVVVVVAAALALLLLARRDRERAAEASED